MSVITKEFLQSMRVSDRAYFHIDEETRTGILSLVKRIGDGAFTEEAEIKHTFPASYTDYGIKGGPREYWQKAFFSISSCHYSGTWQALCLLLRPGDELYLTVVVNNDSEQMRQDGYNRDMLQVSIYRKGKSIVREWTIAVELGPNNSARAVQFSRYKTREELAA